MGGIDNFRQVVGYVCRGLVHPVAIGGFDQYVVYLVKYRRVTQYWLVPPAHVSGKDQPPGFSIVIYLHPDYGRTQDVTRLPEGNLDQLVNPDRFSVFYRGKQGNRRPGIIHRVERYFRERTLSSLPLVASLFEGGVFFLQVGRIEKYYLADFGGCFRAVYFTFETLSHQLGYQAAVVKVRMSQQNRIYRAGRNRERRPVPAGQISFLVQSAVHQNPGMVYLQQIAGTGHVPGRAQKT